MITFDEFKKLDLKIAEILEVKKHPDADRLYILKIETGKETKQIVAGIRPFYKEEELLGKKIVFLNNLEPATIRGVESNGMLLAAKDEQTLAILIPEKDLKTGSPIS